MSELDTACWLDSDIHSIAACHRAFPGSHFGGPIDQGDFGARLERFAGGARGGDRYGDHDGHLPASLNRAIGPVHTRPW